MKRTKLRQRQLPRYSRGEEAMNMITHIAGGGLSVVMLVLGLWKAIPTGNTITILTTAVYGLSMVTLYTMSSLYHGLRPGTAKKVLQVLDHCTIYFLIAGTYTAILLIKLAPVYPGIGWGLGMAQWLLAALAITLTAIDLRKYRVFSMICYIGMGWGIALFLPQALTVMTLPGFLWLLAGGIAYTIGAVLFGLGKKIKWMHSVFHILVVLGTVLQFVAIIRFVF